MDSLIQYLMCVYVTILVPRVDCYIQNVTLNAPVNISCPHSTMVRINNVSVLQDDSTVCNEYRKNCNIMEEDLQIIKEACKTSSTCMFNLNVTTSCIHDYEYFNFSYLCKDSSIIPTKVETTKYTNVTCNFDTSNCSWTSQCSVEWHWIQYRGLDVFNIFDHTTSTGNSKYMEIQTWQPAGTGCLISPPIYPNKHKCLSFWYYIYGRSIKSFEVKQKSRRISLIDISTQGTWNHHSLDIYGDDKYQITFEVNFDKDNLVNPLRRIVVDDVTIADGLCSGETLYTHVCLKIDTPFQMKECPVHDLVNDTFNIELQRRISWTAACSNKMTYNLKRMVDFCKDTYENSTCIIWPSVFLTDDNDCFVIKQTKRLQIHYTCTDFSITSTKASSASETSIASTAVHTTIGGVPDSVVQSPITSYTTGVPDSVVQSPITSYTTGIIVGVVLGFGVIVGLVTILLCFIKRSQSIPKKPGGVGNMLSNDYIGHQSLALPVLPSPMSKDDDYAKIQGKNDNYQHFNSHGLKTSIDASSPNFDKLDQLNKGSNNNARNNMHKDDVTNHDYIYFDETEAGSTQMWIKSPGVNTSQKEIQKKNEYAVIDPNNDHSRGNENYTRHATSPSNNYAILDPNETGFFRSKVNEETITDYDFAVPIDNNEVVSDLHDAYSVVENGAYDTTGKVRLQETYTNIYSHAAENMYDTSSHKRKNVENDGTYDHFFGDKTEDNYNITKRE